MNLGQDEKIALFAGWNFNMEIQNWGSGTPTCGHYYTFVQLGMKQDKSEIPWCQGYSALLKYSILNEKEMVPRMEKRDEEEEDGVGRWEEKEKYI